MARPVTLFTGQWADLPLTELAEKAGDWGFDGLELACWGDHFDVDAALADDGYCREPRELLERHGLKVWAIGNHLVGQAVCDASTRRHQGVVPPDVWGDGDPEGVRQRAAEKLKDTARAAARFGVTTVTGFTGSPIWHLALQLPAQRLRGGRARLRAVRRALRADHRRLRRRGREVRARGPPDRDRLRLRRPRARRSPRSTTARASASTSTRRTSSTSSSTARAFVTEFADRIYHVHVKDSIKRLDGRRSILGGHLNFGEEARGWDFVSPGHGDVDFEALFRTLNRIGYEGPL